MKLGEMIALRREELELAQEDVALDIGASLECIQALENDKPISGKYYFPISKTLELRTCVLCNWEDDFRIVKQWSPNEIEEVNKIEPSDSEQIRAFIVKNGVPFEHIDAIMCNLNKDSRSREERVAYNWARELTREDVIMLAILRGMSQEERSSVLAEIRKRQDNR